MEILFSGSEHYLHLLFNKEFHENRRIQWIEFHARTVVALQQLKVLDLTQQTTYSKIEEIGWLWVNLRQYKQNHQQLQQLSQRQFSCYNSYNYRRRKQFK